jgi:hypothetical protein
MAMKTISLEDAQKSSGRDAHSRGRDEIEAQVGVVPNGHARLKSGRTHQIIWRATDERKRQLQRLAEFLSIGQLQPVTYTLTMERALDALEEKLRGTGK